MDRHQAQGLGATHKADGKPCSDQAMIDAGEDIEVVVMYAHGYVQGHDRCDCQVLMGKSNINAQVLAADGEVSA